MDDLNRSISEYVKSGKYYIDARKWYANKFIFVVSERSYILFLLSFFLAALGISGFFYQLTDPASPEINYIVPSPDIARSYSVIFPAGNSLDNPQSQITKYMLSKYVRKRETYSFNGVEEQINFIKNTTVRDGYINYANMMSINNPSSPMMLYQSDHIKEIKIEDIKLLPLIEGNMRAEVYFQSSLKNLSNNHVDNVDMIASIDFRIDNIETSLSDQAKQLGFLVVNYNLRIK